eukprot:ANDGO_07129.mRNA.1 Protein will die slowly
MAEANDERPVVASRSGTRTLSPSRTPRTSTGSAANPSSSTTPYRSRQSTSEHLGDDVTESVDRIRANLKESEARSTQKRIHATQRAVLDERLQSVVLREDFMDFFNSYFTSRRQLFGEKKDVAYGAGVKIFDPMDSTFELPLESPSVYQRLISTSVQPVMSPVHSSAKKAKKTELSRVELLSASAEDVPAMENGTSCLAHSSRFVFAGGRNGICCVYSLQTGERLQQLRLFEDAERRMETVTALAYSEASDRLWCGFSSGIVGVYSINEHGGIKGHKFFKIHSKAVNGIVFVGKETAWTCSDDWAIKVVTCRNGEVLRTLNSHSGTVHTMTFVPEKDVVISGSADRTIRVWDIHTGTVVKELQTHKDSVEALCVTQGGKRLWAASFDGAISMWDLETFTCLKHLNTQRNSPVSSLCSLGPFVISGGQDRVLYVWDSRSGDFVESLKGHSGSIRQIAVTMDSRYRIWVGTSEKVLRVWTISAPQTTGAHADAFDAPTQFELDENQVVLMKGELQRFCDYFDDLESNYRTTYALLKDVLKSKMELQDVMNQMLDTCGISKEDVCDEHSQLDAKKVCAAMNRGLLAISAESAMQYALSPGVSQQLVQSISSSILSELRPAVSSIQDFQVKFSEDTELKLDGLSRSFDMFQEISSQNYDNLNQELRSIGTKLDVDRFSAGFASLNDSMSQIQSILSASRTTTSDKLAETIEKLNVELAELSRTVENRFDVIGQNVDDVFSATQGLPSIIQTNTASVLGALEEKMSLAAAANLESVASTVAKVVGTSESKITDSVQKSNANHALAAAQASAQASEQWTVQIETALENMRALLSSEMSSIADTASCKLAEHWSIVNRLTREDLQSAVASARDDILGKSAALHEKTSDDCETRMSRLADDCRQRLYAQVQECVQAVQTQVCRNVSDILNTNIRPKMEEVFSLVGGHADKYREFTEKTVDAITSATERIISSHSSHSSHLSAQQSSIAELVNRSFGEGFGSQDKRLSLMESSFERLQAAIVDELSRDLASRFAEMNRVVSELRSDYSALKTSNGALLDVNQSVVKEMRESRSEMTEFLKSSASEWKSALESMEKSLVPRIDLVSDRSSEHWNQVRLHVVLMQERCNNLVEKESRNVIDVLGSKMDSAMTVAQARAASEELRSAVEQSVRGLEDRLCPLIQESGAESRRRVQHETESLSSELAQLVHASSGDVRVVQDSILEVQKTLQLVSASQQTVVDALSNCVGEKTSEILVRLSNQENRLMDSLSASLSTTTSSVSSRLDSLMERMVENLDVAKSIDCKTTQAEPSIGGDEAAAIRMTVDATVLRMDALESVIAENTSRLLEDSGALQSSFKSLAETVTVDLEGLRKSHEEHCTTIAHAVQERDSPVDIRWENAFAALSDRLNDLLKIASVIDGVCQNDISDQIRGLAKQQAMDAEEFKNHYLKSSAQLSQFAAFETSLREVALQVNTLMERSSASVAEKSDVQALEASADKLQLQITELIGMSARSLQTQLSVDDDMMRLRTVFSEFRSSVSEMTEKVSAEVMHLSNAVSVSSGTFSEIEGRLLAAVQEAKSTSLVSDGIVEIKAILQDVESHGKELRNDIFEKLADLCCQEDVAALRQDLSTLRLEVSGSDSRSKQSAESDARAVVSIIENLHSSVECLKQAISASGDAVREHITASVDVAAHDFSKSLQEVKRDSLSSAELLRTELSAVSRSSDLIVDANTKNQNALMELLHQKLTALTDAQHHSAEVLSSVVQKSIADSTGAARDQAHDFTSAVIENRNAIAEKTETVIAKLEGMQVASDGMRRDWDASLDTLQTAFAASHAALKTDFMVAMDEVKQWIGKSAECIRDDLSASDAAVKVEIANAVAQAQRSVETASHSLSADLTRNANFGSSAWEESAKQCVSTLGEMLKLEMSDSVESAQKTLSASVERGLATVFQDHMAHLKTIAEKQGSDTAALHADLHVVAENISQLVAVPDLLSDMKEAIAVQASTCSTQHAAILDALNLTRHSLSKRNDEILETVSKLIHESALTSSKAIEDGLPAVTSKIQSDLLLDRERLAQQLRSLERSWAEHRGVSNHELRDVLNEKLSDLSVAMVVDKETCVADTSVHSEGSGTAFAIGDIRAEIRDLAAMFKTEMVDFMQVLEEVRSDVRGTLSSTEASWSASFSSEKQCLLDAVQSVSNRIAEQTTNLVKEIHPLHQLLHREDISLAEISTLLAEIEGRMHESVRRELASLSGATKDGITTVSSTLAELHQSIGSVRDAFDLSGLRRLTDSKEGLFKVLSETLRLQHSTTAQSLEEVKADVVRMEKETQSSFDRLLSSVRDLIAEESEVIRKGFAAVDVPQPVHVDADLEVLRAECIAAISSLSKEVTGHLQSLAPQVQSQSAKLDELSTVSLPNHVKTLELFFSQTMAATGDDIRSSFEAIVKAAISNSLDVADKMRKEHDPAQIQETAYVMFFNELVSMLPDGAQSIEHPKGLAAAEWFDQCSTLVSQKLRPLVTDLNESIKKLRLAAALYKKDAETTHADLNVTHTRFLRTLGRLREVDEEFEEQCVILQLLDAQE